MAGNSMLFSTKQQDYFMLQALEYSKLSLGSTQTNPPVGAVIVNQSGTIIGQGRTQQLGGNHAEIEAINQAKGNTEGNSIFVTLEPCNNFGRTPPCVDEIIAAGFREVYIGVKDITLAGEGSVARLEAAGIKVAINVLADTIADSVLYPWLFRIKYNRPLITAKFAHTMDGYMAAQDGTSKWITQTTARAHAHKIRSQVGMLAIGTQTVIIDNPSLTARKPDGSLYPNQPGIIVIGNREIPLDSKIFLNNLQVELYHDQVANLVNQNLLTNQLLVEGGAHLLGAFLDADLIDEYYAYISPDLLGSGIASFISSHSATLSDKREFVIVDIKQLGNDVMVKARRSRK